MRRFYQSLIAATAFILILASALFALALEWNTIVNSILGPLEEEWIAYNASRVKSLTLEITSIKVKVSDGSPKIHVIYRRLCRVEVRVENGELLVETKPSHIPFQSLACMGVEAEIWIPKSLEKLDADVNAGILKIQGVNATKASVHVNMGTAKLEMIVKEELKLGNNMGTILAIINANTTRISINNNMGTVKLVLKTHGASVITVENNMGSVASTCPLAPTPTVEIMNNMGSVAIKCQIS